MELLHLKNLETNLTGLKLCCCSPGVGASELQGSLLGQRTSPSKEEHGETGSARVAKTELSTRARYHSGRRGKVTDSNSRQTGRVPCPSFLLFILPLRLFLTALFRNPARMGKYHLQIPISSSIDKALGLRKQLIISISYVSRALLIASVVTGDMQEVINDWCDAV